MSQSTYTLIHGSYKYKLLTVETGHFFSLKVSLWVWVGVRPDCCLKQSPSALSDVVIPRTIWLTSPSSERMDRGEVSRTSVKKIRRWSWAMLREWLVTWFKELSGQWPRRSDKYQKKSPSGYPVLRRDTQSSIGMPGPPLGYPVIRRDTRSSVGILSPPSGYSVLRWDVRSSFEIPGPPLEYPVFRRDTRSSVTYPSSVGTNSSINLSVYMRMYLMKFGFQLRSHRHIYTSEFSHPCANLLILLCKARSSYTVWALGLHWTLFGIPRSAGLRSN
jgi:hypothetical protein